MEKIYDVMITYDISTNGDSKIYGAVKEAMISKGYADRFTHSGTGNVMYLPNTTLWKKGQTCKGATDDLQSCVDTYNYKNSTKHKIERGIATQFDNYWAFYGEPHQINSTAPVKN